jgi:hypothetical protein
MTVAMPAESYPDSSHILGHDFTFDPDWWRDRIPDRSWADYLDRLPEAANGQRTITRADLLSAIKDGVPDPVVLLYCYGQSEVFIGTQVPGLSSQQRKRDLTQAGRRSSSACRGWSGGGLRLDAARPTELARIPRAVLVYQGALRLRRGRRRTTRASTDIGSLRRTVTQPGDGLGSKHDRSVATVDLRTLAELRARDRKRATRTSGLEVRADAVEMALFQSGGAK